MWQICPVCYGAGIVSGGYFARAGDVLSWTSYNTTETCQICNGQGIIHEVTGLPPMAGVVETLQETENGGQPGLPAKKGEIDGQVG